LEQRKILLKRFLPIVFLVAGVLIGFFLRDMLAKHEARGPLHSEFREGGFRYVNPLLDCESSSDADENLELRPLEHRIRQVINDQRKRGWLSDESVYFRTLNSGKWLSVNPTVLYYPASLMKVPVMIAILKQAELNPRVLGAKIRFTGATALSDRLPYFPPSKKLEAGKSYTVEELLNRMIVYSDNDALFLLGEHVGKPLISRTFRELRLPDPFAESHGEQDYSMTVEQYVMSLRILYNASYLSKEMSERALELLTKVEFRQGMVEGVPPDVPVAHKFGERVWEDTSQGKELHDCGIIYYPARPYLLCIMTRGDSFEYLDDGIKETARIVYEEIDRFWKEVDRKKIGVSSN
jgi:beta-lactamase class A